MWDVKCENAGHVQGNVFYLPCNFEQLLATAEIDSNLTANIYLLLAI